MTVVVTLVVMAIELSIEVLNVLFLCSFTIPHVVKEKKALRTSAFISDNPPTTKPCKLMLTINAFQLCGVLTNVAEIVMAVIIALMMVVLRKKLAIKRLFPIEGSRFLQYTSRVT